MVTDGDPTSLTDESTRNISLWVKEAQQKDTDALKKVLINAYVIDPFLICGTNVYWLFLI